MRTKYPRTRHLPWSPGATADDVRLSDLSGFVGEEVVVTEKLDGENTTLGPDYTHARSVDSAHHSSRSWVKALHGRIAHRIPAGFRVCGENLYARHSVAYDHLPAFFFVFNIWDDQQRCLSWDDTVAWSTAAGIPTAPVLWRGPFDERALRALKVDTRTSEGFVVRVTRAFSASEFPACVAKWVRAGHVTDTSGVHWMHRTIAPNGLAPTAALWTLRSGGLPAVSEVLHALGLPEASTGPPGALAALAARIDGLDRPAESRLAGLVAGCILVGGPAADPMLLPRLYSHLPARTARSVMMLLQLRRHPTRAVPDDTRRAGLVQLARSVDLGLLHALSGWWCAQRGDVEGAEQVAWSELHGDDAGLLGPAPFQDLWDGLAPHLEADPMGPVLWDRVVRAFGQGRLRSPEEARATLPSLRASLRPGGVTVLVGPAGSGKSTWIHHHARDLAVVSLDDLRARRGDRADQSDNAAVLREAVALLVEHLRAGTPLVWDATSLTRKQRALVLDKARRYHVPTRIVSIVTGREVLTSRNARRTHSVPPAVLGAQCASVEWPLASEAHLVEDQANGTLWPVETGREP